MAGGIVITNPDDFVPEGTASPAATQKPASIVITKPDAFVPEAPAARKPGKLEAAAFGAASGATAGLSSWLAGGMGAYGMVDDFGRGDGAAALEVSRKVREEFKAKEAAARQAEPEAYGVGQFAGAVLTPGPKGVLANSAIGGVYGAAESQGETLGDVVGDAALGFGVTLATGGAIKGTGAGIKKVVSGAPGRVEKRATDALLEGTPAKTVQDPALAALGGKAGLTKALKAEGLLGKPASKIDAALTGRMNEVGEKLGEIYRKVDESSPGVPPEYVRDKLLGLAQKHRSDPDSADAIRSYANRLAAEYTDDGAIPAQEMHKAVQALGKRGYGTNPQNPSMSAALKRDIRSEVLEVLQQHVDDVSKGNPEIGNLAELRKLNGQYRTLVNMDNVAAAKATRDERVSPTLGQRMREGVRNVTDIGAVGGIVAGAMDGNATLAGAALAAGVAARAAPHVVAAADRLAANLGDSKLANYLRGSGSGQELLERAVRVGIPREVAMQAIQGQEAQPPGMQPLPGLDGGSLLSGR